MSINLRTQSVNSAWLFSASFMKPFIVTISFHEREGKRYCDLQMLLFLQSKGPRLLFDFVLVLAFSFGTNTHRNNSPCRNKCKDGMPIK